MVYCDTLPLPETRHVFPSSDWLRVESISEAK